MLTYHTPGVHYERFDATAPRVSAIRTDIAGFVGIAERGPIDTPIPVESYRQFESHFGSFSARGYLAFCVRAFFENGGRRCWIVRVAGGVSGADARAAQAEVRAASGESGLRIVASTPGVWGESITVELREVRAAQTLISDHFEGARSSHASSTGGFGRRSFVRLRQAVGGVVNEAYRVVSNVDHAERTLTWISDDRDLRLDTDSPLTGFAADAPIQAEALEYELLSRRDGRLVQVARSLSLVPDHERFIATLLGPAYDAPESEARRRTVQSPRLIEVIDVRDDPSQALAVPPEPVSLRGGVEGIAALRPFDFVGEDSSVHDSDEVQRQRRRGVQALGLVDEIAIVAVPDIHIRPVPEPLTVPPEVCVPDPCLPSAIVPEASPLPRSSGEMPPVFDERAIAQVQADLITHCEHRGDRFALLDPPFDSATDAAAGLTLISQWRRRFESKYAALYWPWLKVSNPLPGVTDLTRPIPPSGHVAGQFAATDLMTGVHKAPANASIIWAQDVTAGVDDAVHGILNDLGIDAIRAIPGRGIRVMGGRTLSSDPDARFINVRRLIMMVIKAIDLSTQWAVFEPNSVYTRAKVRVSIVSFLTALWQNGALMGDSAQAAFFVRCDETNNPSESRDRGRLVADVGIAPSVPFEFVVVRVGRMENALEVSETLMTGGGG